MRQHLHRHCSATYRSSPLIQLRSLLGRQTCISSAGNIIVARCCIIGSKLIICGASSPSAAHLSSSRCRRDLRISVQMIINMCNQQRTSSSSSSYSRIYVLCRAVSSSDIAGSTLVLCIAEAHHVLMMRGARRQACVEICHRHHNVIR